MAQAWQDVQAQQWGQVGSVRALWVVPAQLRQLGTGLHRVCQAGEKNLAVDLGGRLVGGRRAKASQLKQCRFVEAQLQLFLQFVAQSVQGRFPWLDLAAGQHEGAGVALAHQQQVVAGVQQADGGDAQQLHAPLRRCSSRRTMAA